MTDQLLATLHHVGSPNKEWTLVDIDADHVALLTKDQKWELISRTKADNFHERNYLLLGRDERY